LDEVLRESLQIIADSSKSLLEMINLSLDLFKMERNLYQMNPQSLSLPKLLQRITKELHPIARSSALSITLHIPQEAHDNSFCIQAEELLCYSLFGNLLKNSMEAAPWGSEISININLHTETSKIIVSIKNGGEIPLQIRNKLFTKFATAGKPNGSGLGLYSAFLIAKTIGASIHADTSEPGFTTMNLIFPTS
jgi:signal transduction histidine kinase